MGQHIGEAPKLGFRAKRRLLTFRLLAMVDRVLPSKGVSIALYHQVIDTPTDYRIGGHVSPRAFRQQMHRLAQRGYRGVSIGEYLALRREGSPLLSKIVGLTFDDGQLDFYTHAFPILKELGFSATVFIVTDYVGQEKWFDSRKSSWSDRQPHQRALYYRFMDWNQIGEIQAAGFELGSHTCSHPCLTELPLEEMRREVEVSKATLEQTLGQSVDVFGYPFGRHNDVVRQVVVEAGYRAACSTDHGLNKRDTDPFALRRYGIASITGAPFDIYLTNKYAWYYRHSRHQRRRGES